MNSLKKMLKRFDINTMECMVSNKRIRKDGKIIRDIRFRLKTTDNDKFIREIGWIK